MNINSNTLNSKPVILHGLVDINEHHSQPVKSFKVKFVSLHHMNSYCKNLNSFFSKVFRLHIITVLIIKISKIILIVSTTYILIINFNSITIHVMSLLIMLIALITLLINTMTNSIVFGFSFNTLPISFFEKLYASSVRLSLTEFQFEVFFKF